MPVIKFSDARWMQSFVIERYFSFWFLLVVAAFLIYGVLMGAVPMGSAVWRSCFVRGGEAAARSR